MVAESGRYEGPKFPLGVTVHTPGAIAAVGAAGILNALKRHANLEQGDLTVEDHAMNLAAVDEGERILSVYGSVWVITEADRSVTTVLLPSEY